VTCFEDGGVDRASTVYVARGTLCYRGHPTFYSFFRTVFHSSNRQSNILDDCFEISEVRRKLSALLFKY